MLNEFQFDGLDFNDKSILITGGTGSFGRACAQLILDSFAPRRLIIYSRDEAKQFDMANEFADATNAAVPSGASPLRFSRTEDAFPTRFECAARAHVAMLKARDRAAT